MQSLRENIFGIIFGHVDINSSWVMIINVGFTKILQLWATWLFFKWVFIWATMMRQELGLLMWWDWRGFVQALSSHGPSLVTQAWYDGLLCYSLYARGHDAWRTCSVIIHNQPRPSTTLPVVQNPLHLKLKIESFAFIIYLWNIYNEPRIGKTEDLRYRWNCSLQ